MLNGFEESINWRREQILLADNISYFILARPPDFNNLNEEINRFNKNKTNHEDTNKTNLWRENNLGYSNDFHDGILRSLTSNYDSEKESVVKRYSITSNPILNDSQYLDITNKYKLFLGSDFTLASDQRLCVKLTIKEVEYSCFRVGVNFISLAIQFESLDIIGVTDHCHVVDSQIDITMNDVAELNYIVSHLIQREILAPNENNRKRPSFRLYPAKHKSLSPKLHEKAFDSILQLLNKNDDTKKISPETLRGFCNSSLTLAIGFSNDSLELNQFLKTHIPDDAFPAAYFSRPLVITQLIAGQNPQLTASSSELKATTVLLQKIAQVHNSEYSGSGHSRMHRLGAEDIQHYICREGGCIFVNPNLGSNFDRPFIKNFISDSGKKIYLQILLLTFMQYAFLHGLDQNLILGSDNQTLDLEQLQNELIKFRVNQLFTDVSLIDVHNQCYERWEKVFSIKALQKRLDLDLTDTRRLIDIELQKISQAHQKKMGFIAIIATSAISLTGFFGMNFKEMGDIRFLPESASLTDTWHLIFTVLVVSVTGIYYYYHNKK